MVEDVGAQETYKCFECRLVSCHFVYTTSWITDFRYYTYIINQ